MLLDRNLSSVVRDAPYAVDHLSACSQRPIISCDTCDSPPIKSATCYVSHRRLWRRFFRNARQRNLKRPSVRIVYRTRDSYNRNLRTQIREMFSQACSSSWNTWCSPSKKSHGI